MFSKGRSQILFYDHFCALSRLNLALWGLQRKLWVHIPKVEQILQTRAEQIDHHDVVVALNTVPPDTWDTYSIACTIKDLVQPAMEEAST